MVDRARGVKLYESSAINIYLYEQYGGGVGEAPIVPPAAAIGNAINDALGIRMTELPMTSGKLYEAINSSDA